MGTVDQFCLKHFSKIKPTKNDLDARAQKAVDGLECLANPTTTEIASWITTERGVTPADTRTAYLKATSLRKAFFQHMAAHQSEQATQCAVESHGDVEVEFTVPEAYLTMKNFSKIVSKF